MQPAPLSSAKGLGPVLWTHHPSDQPVPHFLLPAHCFKHSLRHISLAFRRADVHRGRIYTELPDYVCIQIQHLSLPRLLEEFVVVLLLFPDPWDPTLLVPLMNQPWQVQVPCPFPGLSGNWALLTCLHPSRPGPPLSGSCCTHGFLIVSQ